MKPIKLLLVDDEPIHLDLSFEFLKKEDEWFVVDTATSAEEALDLIEEKEYDCIVSDYQMPSMDGLEFLDTVRNELDMQTPFIMFTGKGREEVAMEALNMGADRYIRKGGDPKIQFGVLSDAIKQEVENHRRKKELEKSEKEKSIILDRSSDAIAYHDSEHNVIWANSSYLEGAGMTLEEIEGKKCFDAWYGRDEPCEGCPTDEALKTGEVEREEVSPPEDNRVWLITATPINDEEGNIKGIIESSLDITEQKKIERNLKESQEKYRSLFDQSMDAIYLHDKRGNILEVNERACKQSGYNRQELLDMGVFDLYIDETDSENQSKEEVLKNWEEWQAGVRHTIEGEHQHKNGSIYPVKIVAGVVEYGNEELIMGIVRDVTDQKEKERELKRKEEYIDHTPEYILVLDEEGNIKYHSYPSNDILELNPSEFMGAEVLEFAHPDDREKALEIFLEILENPDEEYRAEIRGRGEEDWIWFEIRAVNHLDNPEVEGIIITALDITKRKEAEEEIKEAKERLDLALKGTKAGIWDWYVQTGNTVFNERWTEIVGYELEELEPTNIETWRELSHPEDLKRSEELLEKHFAGETDMYEFEGRMKHKDGHWVWIIDRGKVVEWDDEGNPVRMTGTHVDITDRKKAEGRKEFLHSLLRHDVKNKVQIVKGYLELMEDFELPEECFGYIDKTKKAARNITDLVEEIKTLNKLEDQMDGSKEVNIQQIIQNVVNSYEDRISEKDRKLKLNLDFDIDTEDKSSDYKVEGNFLLEEVFNNLLANSIKHSKGDTIRITTRELKGEVIITVEDDGKGISDEDKDKIFDRGYKSGETGETGIGLYLVKEIVENCNGIVEFKDSELGGARFDIRLEKV